MAEWEGYHRFPASYVVRAYLNSTPATPTTTKHTKTSESGQGIIRQSFSPSTLEAGVWVSEVQGQPMLRRSCFKNLRRGTREMTWHSLLLQKTSPVSSIHAKQLAAAHNSHSKDPKPASGLHGHLHTCGIHICTHSNTRTKTHKD